MRTTKGRCLATAAVLAFWFAGCGPDDAERSVKAKAQRAAELASDPELADALGQAVRLRAGEAAAGWVKHDHALRGTLAERGRQSFLSVLLYGRCYRYLAAASPTVSDLDLALFDANNVEIARDVTEDRSPELGVSVSICPAEPTQARIEARMRRGYGDFLIGVFESEPSL